VDVSHKTVTEAVRSVCVCVSMCVDVSHRTVISAVRSVCVWL